MTLRWSALWLGMSVIASVAVTSRLEAQAARPTRIRDVPCRSVPAIPSGPPMAWRGTAVRWAEWPVQLGASAVNARLIVVTIDPARVALALDVARDGDQLGAWTIDRAPEDALIALNAGQFTDDGPWGWVVHRGREWQAPGIGSLSGVFAIDSTGGARIVGAAQLPAMRQRGGLVEAVQSYPMLLEKGRAPEALCAGDAIDRTHRDTRLAIGVRADGTVVLAMSRYAGVGSGVTEMAERLPIGPTTPEMAEIMRRLGAVSALMLDGGLSAQLRLRDGREDRRWAGLRAVPLALIGRAR